MRSTEIRSQFVARHERAARWTLTAVWALVLVALAVAGTCAPSASAAEHGIPPQAQQAAVVGVAAKPAPVSLNATFRALSLAQGVPTGSPAWNAGGLLAFSGTTGAHPAYGWDHEHLLNEAWVRAVIANYAARPAYYDFAPARHSGYLMGCRPLGWVPATEVHSLPDGAQLVDGVAASGPDLEHFALDPLFAVARSHGYTVPRPGQPGGIAAEVPAKAMLRLLMAAHAGMLRTASGGLTTYVCSDRCARYIAGNLAAATSLGCIEPADAATLHDYIRTRLVPRWLAPPSNDPSKGGDLQVYNGVSWAVPALWDLVQVTPPGQYRRDLWTALQTQCRRLALLAAVVPGKACTVEKVATWSGLTAAGVTTLSYLGPWGVRGQLVAGKVLGSPECAAEGLAEAAKWRHDPAQRAWLVGVDGGYLFGDGF